MKLMRVLGAGALLLVIAGLTVAAASAQTKPRKNLLEEDASMMVVLCMEDRLARICGLKFDRDAHFRRYMAKGETQRRPSVNLQAARSFWPVFKKAYDGMPEEHGLPTCSDELWDAYHRAKARLDQELPE